MNNLYDSTILCWFMYSQVEMEEREERKRMQELREQERRQEDERERLLEQKQVTHLVVSPAVSSL